MAVSTPGSARKNRRARTRRSSAGGRPWACPAIGPGKRRVAQPRTKQMALLVLVSSQRSVARQHGQASTLAHATRAGRDGGAAGDYVRVIFISGSLQDRGQY